MDRPGVVTFDCYGTLVDWRKGIVDAFRAEAMRLGVACPEDEILSLHAEVEPQVQAAGYAPYREVLERVADAIAQRLGWALGSGQARFLPDSLPDWPAFPDTNAALESLQDAGCRLGILSNIDDDLFAETKQHLAVDFDVVITAQQVRAYKPAHAHFLAARERLGLQPWLHAAQSYFHDVVPARELGIPVAWVNRLGELPDGDARPDHEVTDMRGLASWVGGLSQHSL